MQGIRRIALGLAAAGLILASQGARAQLTEADVGLNPTYQQTGDTLADVTSTGGFFSAEHISRIPATTPGEH